MLEASSNHAQISAKAKLANASRINSGRTGPKGIAGVTKELAHRLGREPEQAELEEELRRDLGIWLEVACKGKDSCKSNNGGW